MKRKLPYSMSFRTKNYMKSIPMKSWTWQFNSWYCSHHEMKTCLKINFKCTCVRRTEAFSSPFSFQETMILFVSTKNRNIWPLPIFEHAQNTRSVVFSQPDLSDLNNESVNRGLPVLVVARGLDSWCWPKRSWPLGTRMFQAMQGLKWIKESVLHRK